eukprot:CAMPEP_0170648668 /NCGR_PEP_ID=MMETSP0224-20130122/44857_1 /TAXON_ID=285029 /ORGANISM="Togula jolla, Strain CCCM 725" /LENGTH=776 /DNA_ID=CAMNT_0010980209 /DNA_START=26 /DNA_END=2356 /DNA_ORIENTATION=-
MSVLTIGKSTTSRNASATLAFHQFRTPKSEEEEVDLQKTVRLGIDKADAKFRAKIFMEISSSFSLLGPLRDTRPEAVLDGLELGKMFVEKGAAGARATSNLLKRKQWTPREIHGADEQDLDNFVFSKKAQKGDGLPSQKLIPPGEGWVRHDEDTLVHPKSQVYFVQIGRKAGHYMLRSLKDQRLEDCEAPHKPVDHQLSVSAASASNVRRGVKLDRAVLLNDIPKIARLSLKFPLSFVDTPASAYALFQGLRSAESAQWCAENFHKKLFPLLAEKIHTYETHELQMLLCKTLEALDAELLRSTHAFSGVGAILALVLGNRLVVAGVGHVSAVLIPSKGSPRKILQCTGRLDDTAECERIREAAGVVRENLVFGHLEGGDEAARILAARHAFDILQIEPGGPTDEKQVRSAYRRLALRVHPDKQGEGADHTSFKAAFARLEGAREVLEAMVNEHGESCRELARVLRSEVHTRAGAAALLGLDKTPTWDTAQLAEDGEKACKDLVKRMAKMQSYGPYEQAVAICKEAVECIRRPCTLEALPRQEALLREGLSTGRAMGARDLRKPSPIVLMRPQFGKDVLPSSGSCRLALLCGASATLDMERLAESTQHLARQPKATALRWCLDADRASPCCSAVCVRFESTVAPETPMPLSKKPRTTSGYEGTVRIRHILFKHKQLRQPDPMQRREGSAATAQDAEEQALSTLEKLLKEPNLFLKLCRELSDCESASQPGTLAGDLGWLARGQQEAAFDDAAFALRPNDYGDLFTSSRGVHIIQRLA